MNALRPSIPQIPFDPVRAYSAGANIKSMRAQNELARRGMALQERQFGATQEEHERQRDAQAYTRLTQLMGRVVDEPSYRAARNMFLRDFPDEAEDFPENYEQGRGLVSMFREPEEAYTLAPGAARYRGEEVIAEREAKPAATTKIGKLLEERNALAPDDPKREVYDRTIEKEATRTGMVVESTPEGGLTVRTGVPMTGEGAAMFTKPTQTKIETELLNATKGLSRVTQIASMYKSEYQELPARWSTMWTAGKEKMGVKPGGEERKQLEEYATFRRRAISNINLYIKEITGAQMSEREASRLMKAMPSPGQGIFDGDSPTVFKAKLDDVTTELRMATARFCYIRRRGLKFGDIPLSSMGTVINSRGKEIEEELLTANPGIDPGDLQERVVDQLADEFGLVR